MTDRGIGAIARAGLLAWAALAAGWGAGAASEEIAIREAVAVARIAAPGRVAVSADAVRAQVVAGTWTLPRAGATVELPDGSTRTWEPIRAGDDGAFTGPALRGGYLAAGVESEADRVMILEAAGHGMVYLDGAPRAGDPYSYGWFRVPVKLKAGTTPLLFAAGRGRVKARLVTPEGPAQLDPDDATVPDLVVGEPAGERLAAVVVLNATEATASTLVLELTCGDGPATTRPVPPLTPLTRRKVGFAFQAPAIGAEGTVPLAIRLVDTATTPPTALDSIALDLRARTPAQSRKRTFVSGIDGSVQYYAVQPRTPDPASKDRPALILTLHGASVEAIGQADAYAPKDWAHIVAPTNRRPYGFDWEDWGRLDALEVLAETERALGTDPRRTYLTGHSMGGHGTWHLGVTFPARWAAVAPSAGWVSMWSYAGARRAENPSPVVELLSRAARPSDTLGLAGNLARDGVYVLHGDADDNVPVGQARTMRAELARFHPDFAYREQPGAGHWWGSECVDWPPLMAFLRERTNPAQGDVRRVDFRIANPGVSADCDWLTIARQVEPLNLSRAAIDHDPKARTFRGTTENVALLGLDAAHLDGEGPITVALDGRELTVERPGAGGRIWLARSGEEWSVAGAPAPSAKGPHRNGAFKDAFRNRVVLVYGTRGTPEENAWALARARFDAETFGYRGNGSVEVVPDAAFDPAAEPDRNVVLYGNADTHAAWPALLGSAPIRAARGILRVGDREATGDDLALLAIRPRPGSDVASVGVVSGTGPAGLRLTDGLPIFVSGVAYPDLVVLGPEVLREGANAVRAAGFFGPDWGVDSGTIAWRGR